MRLTMPNQILVGGTIAAVEWTIKTYNGRQKLILTKRVTLSENVLFASLLSTQVSFGLCWIRRNINNP